MKEKVTFEMRPGYMYVRVTGEFSLEETIKAFPGSMEIIHSHNATKVLIDCLDLRGSPSVSDYYAYGELTAKEFTKPSPDGTVRPLQAAYVGIAPLLDREHFSELVATNRGANVKFFDSMEEAKKWLGV